MHFESLSILPNPLVCGIDDSSLVHRSQVLPGDLTLSFKANISTYDLHAVTFSISRESAGKMLVAEMPYNLSIHWDGIPAPVMFVMALFLLMSQSRP
jgi:hypothetical protein